MHTPTHACIIYYYSGADVYDRVSMFLDSLYRDMRKGHCGENVVIVSHGLFCRLFLTRFYHWKVRSTPY
jgi:broad specificity phosphatase PhoE